MINSKNKRINTFKTTIQCHYEGDAFQSEFLCYSCWMALLKPIKDVQDREVRLLHNHVVMGWLLNMTFFLWKFEIMST